MTQCAPVNLAPTSTGTSSRRVALWVLLLLSILAMAVYANSLRNVFALDDVAIIQDSEHVNNLQWVEIWTTNYWPPDEGAAPDVLYRPLTIWSYLATHALAPGATWVYHLGNILLHALVTVMATVLTWRLFGSRAVAILAGVIFALHPLHTEVVANIVGRAELLSTVFSLAALLIFLPDRPLLEEKSPVRRSYWHGLLVAACFLLAILCKETPVTLLGGFVFIDFWRWSHWEKGRRPALWQWFARQGARYYLPLFAAFGIYLAMRINACGLMRDIHAIHPIVNPLVNATIAERLVTPFVLLTKYLQLTMWPRVLSADYSYPSILPTANPLAPLALIGLLVSGLAVIVTLKCWRRLPQIALTIVLFFCVYALASNFLRIGTIMGERLFYLPSLFVFMLVAWCAMSCYRAMGNLRYRVLWRSVAVGLVVFASLAMADRTLVRNTDWQDNIPLAIATARDNPNSAKACYWAGNILATSGSEKWMQEFGVQLLMRSIELCPEYGLPYWELAKYHGREQHLGKSLIYLAQAAHYAPGTNDIRMALRAIKTDLKSGDVAGYMSEITAYKAAHGGDPAADLALAVAYTAQGKLPEAEEASVAALTIDGRFHEAACELALVRFDRGQQELAIDMLRQYVMQMKNTVEARCTLAGALMNLNPQKYPHALAEAGMNLDKAEAIYRGSTRVRELRAELLRKRAAQGTLTMVLPTPVASPVAKGSQP